MPFVLGWGERMKMNGTRGWGTVSYTHLTLPTIA